MLSKLLALSIFASVVSHCVASPDERVAFELVKRQTVPVSPSQIPAACSATCAPIDAVVNSCEDLSCLCNNTVSAQIAVCIDCIVFVSGDTTSSTTSQSQNLINQYVNACDTSGQPISSIIVSSVSPTATGGSQSTASGASSGSINPTASPSISFSSSGSSPSTTTSGAFSIRNAGLYASNAVAALVGTAFLFVAL
ncbi:hypothetical protein SCHPADRAFT_931980 [Schizopora paradoxa]|uniref:Extracellular membrane protein CFEM domain-containing protein n=1 Tax=Schizopora paradoxa TaxID=27342 RepID=A0A0H2R8L9_9AGAM|nr:hypothetical protein SCHPADRAFT_931980 [Schizopora paradoxa]